MKNFIMGMMTVLLIEAGLFVWNTCGVRTETKFWYNPDAVVQMFGEYSETVR